MFCSKCGGNNADDAKFCTTCGSVLTPQQEANNNTETKEEVTQTQSQTQIPAPEIQYVNTQEPMPKVQNYLVFSILVTIFCCLPLGIVAIINSSNVDKELVKGNYEGAVNASKQAKLFSIIGLVVGGIISLGYIIVTIITTLAAYS